MDGSLKVIDGRGYSSDGKLIFNAFGVLSYDSAQHSYSMHSYAQGHSGDFDFKPSANGYTWEIPAGPMTIRYTAQVEDGVLHEVGVRILPGKDPVQFFEMNVRQWEIPTGPMQERSGRSDHPDSTDLPAYWHAAISRFHRQE